MNPEELNDLEADIMNELQKNKSGLTVEELSHRLKGRTHTDILTVLDILLKANSVTVKNGVWIMVRQ
jgi:predicted transcriptional regulator